MVIDEVTASIGVHEYNFEENSFDDGIYVADQMMYRSKINGRNQVTISSELIFDKTAL